MRAEHSNGRRRGTALLVAIAAVAMTAGCSSQTVGRGWMPGDSDQEVTNRTGMVSHLWVGTWVAALVIGVFVWGLMLWCMAAYRRRRGETTLPVQMRYHLPIEMLFTVTPIFMVLSLFFFTARDMAIVNDTSKTPDLKVTVIGKQWAWDYNYTSAGVWESTTMVNEMQKTSPTVEDQANVPTLWLPVNKNVEITLQSRDVAHSFWVPAFLYKLDLIPGRVNKFQVTPTKEGTYAGKCAELCGEYHSEMLFNVKVVSQADYDAHMAQLKTKGNTGSLPVDLGRSGTIVEGNE